MLAWMEEYANFDHNSIPCSKMNMAMHIILMMMMIVMMVMVLVMMVLVMIVLVMMVLVMMVLMVTVMIIKMMTPRNLLRAQKSPLSNLCKL